MIEYFIFFILSVSVWNVLSHSKNSILWFQHFWCQNKIFGSISLTNTYKKFFVENKYFEWALRHVTLLCHLDLEPIRALGLMDCYVPTDLVKFGVKESIRMGCYYITPCVRWLKLLMAYCGQLPRILTLYHYISSCNTLICKPLGKISVEG